MNLSVWPTNLWCQDKISYKNTFQTVSEIRTLSMFVSRRYQSATVVHSAVLIVLFSLMIASKMDSMKLPVLPVAINFNWLVRFNYIVNIGK